MNAPELLECHGFADLPPLRVGGVICMVMEGQDRGISTFFTAKGFQLATITVEDATLYDYCGLAARTLPSATRLVVGIGGYAAMEAAKLVAARHKLPLWCIPTDYTATSATLCRTLWEVDRTPAFVETPSHTTVMVESLLSPSRDGVQQAYQHLFACYVGMTMTLYRNRLAGEEGANESLEALVAKAKETLLSIHEYALPAGKKIWSTLAECAECADIREIQLLARAICVYKKRNMPYNRYVFAAAYALATAIAEWRDVPDLYLAPDRRATASTIRSLGWREGEAARPHPEWDWAWRDYLEDAQTDLAIAPEAARRWRRLAGNAGYGYFEDLSAEELVSLLPVVAELTPTYTPFRHLYLRGGLNLFI